MKKIWIAWEEHRRTSEIVAAMQDVRLFTLSMNAGRLVRYPVLLLKTLNVLRGQKPDVVIIQNPSIVLALFMVTVGRIWVKNVVVDAHNEGIRPFYDTYNWLLPLYAFIQKKSRLTIVTTESLAVEVRRNGGRPFVLEDKIPRIKGSEKIPLQGDFNIVFICTYERDEPYLEVIQSGALLDPRKCVYITGRHEKLPRQTVSASPENIIYTGFLSEEDYLNLLHSCDAVMDLTFMENCLVCGAYEAVALHKPMILTDTSALRSYFNRGAVYTANHPQAIAAAVDKAIEQLPGLQQEIASLDTELQRNWEIKFNKLTRLIDAF